MLVRYQNFAYLSVDVTPYIQNSLQNQENVIVYSCASKSDDAIFLLESVQEFFLYSEGWQISKVRKTSPRYVYQATFETPESVGGDV